MTKTIVDTGFALAELVWLIRHSDGVVGLRADGTMMPWAEVLDLYIPTAKKLNEVLSP